MDKEIIEKIEDIINDLESYPKTKEDRKRRTKEFDRIYNSLFSEFDLKSHPVYSYDEIRFRRAIVFGYKKALEKLRKKLKLKGVKPNSSQR